MTLLRYNTQTRDGRRARLAAAAALPVAAAACALTWAYLHQGVPGFWMRMPVDGGATVTGRAAYPGVPAGIAGSRAIAGRQPSAAGGPASPVPGLVPGTSPVVAGEGTLVPFPAETGIDLASLGPRFGAGMTDPPYRWWVVGGTPPGFGEPSYDARTGSWSFTGVPEREGVYRLSMAWARNGDRPTVLSANVLVSPPAGGAPVAAVAQVDGRAFVGQALGEQAAFHGYLLPLGGDCATWAVETGDLPPGVALSPGCLPPGSAVIDPASIPAAAGRHGFTLSATAPDGTVAATEEVVLNVAEPVLAIAVARRGPATADGRPVAYKATASYGAEEFPAAGFASGASAGDAVTYGMEGSLPPGLTFAPETGTVSGVVRKGAAGDFRLHATMSRPDGSRETVYGEAVTYGSQVQAAD